MEWRELNSAELSDKEFSQWQGLLETRVGMSLAASQRQFLQSQLNMRLRELSEDSYSSYMKRILDSKNGAIEWAILTDRLVINETNFMRHPASFDYVDTVLAEKLQSGMTDSFDVWSLACATGEESYSLAMTLNERFETTKMKPNFSVFATDISRSAVTKARKAIYSKRKLEFVSEDKQRKYFCKLDTGQYEFAHNIKRQLCFSVANILKKEDIPPTAFDIIYCQNVLIYFKEALKHQLLDSMAEQLKPGGVLIIGLGEAINWTNSLIEKAGHNGVQAYVRQS